jgi:hypothetical protein
MGDIVGLAFLSALNPTLLVVTTVLILLPHSEGLMFGYWLGAMLTSVTTGLVIVFVLKDTSAEHTTKHTLGPVVWLAVAVLLLVAAFALAKGADRRVRERRKARLERKGEEKKTPKWQKTLREGNPWQSFAVGILLSFPGVEYLAALDRLIHLHYSTTVSVLVVIGFCLMQLFLLEIPMLAFRIWPKGTPAAIDKAKAWTSTHGREWAVWALGFLGVAVAIPSVIALV